MKLNVSEAFVIQWLRECTIGLNTSTRHCTFRLGIAVCELLSKTNTGHYFTWKQPPLFIPLSCWLSFKKLFQVKYFYIAFMNRPKIFETWNAAGSQLDMQAFTPLCPLSAQAGTGEGEQAGLEFWDGIQKLCHSEATGVRGDEKRPARVHTVAWFDGSRRGGSEVMGEGGGSRERRRGILPVTWAIGSR